MISDDLRWSPKYDMSQENQRDAYWEFFLKECPPELR